MLNANVLKVIVLRILVEILDYFLHILLFLQKFKLTL